MPNNERIVGEAPEESSPHQHIGLDVPALETALHAPPEMLLDSHLGPGVAFRFGEEATSLELYSQVVRLKLPRVELAVPRRDPRVSSEGVVFEDPERFFLSVGPRGDVLFQYSPSPPAADDERLRSASGPAPAALMSPPVQGESPAALPAPPPAVPEAKGRAESEKHIGRMGEVKTHTTRQGTLVAEVELTVADPDRPGSSKLVKFAAFGTKAEVLQRDYSPGQEVVAVGIPHELKRRSHDGREWVERQLYLVQPPKVR